MSYQVLARKWRPKSFDTLIGQEHVVRALTNALEQQRLHHAYLFTGTRGVGKTTIARILAKSLNCETGITAHPCGVCSACVEIDKGRFIDLIEVDAASNTQVDNMRDLLDNAQYAPTSGRFKVYIIDEVHMLTRNSFNAMLKTLEEPPAHVKFILATTDPQKMPVTVLSRCLQFNLRQMASTSIIEHCQAILNSENIPAETPALNLIAKAAAGSMRDALSLLDQAIAYGGQTVNEKEVRAMLGAIDQHYLFDLLNALVAQDGNALIEQAKSMEQRSIAFDGALADLASLLQQVAVAQVVPDSISQALPERASLMDLAQKMSAEKVQLYYQIALTGRRDLGLAPDEFAGFSMTLLRMLAFSQSDTLSSTPSGQQGVGQNHSQAKPTVSSAIASQAVGTEAPKPSASIAPVVRSATATLNAATESARPAFVERAPVLATTSENHAAVETLQATVEVTHPVEVASPAENKPAPISTIAETPEAEEIFVDTQTASMFGDEPMTETPPIQEISSITGANSFDGNWRGLIDELKLGLARTLALNCELASFDDNNINLTVPESEKHLLDATYQDKLSAAIQQHFGRKIKLNLTAGGTGNTPAKQIFEEKAAVQSQAVSAIEQDPFVQALVSDFGAHVIPSSIKPIQ
jgi:DNA polymerase-3 subunit gamma/tau